MKTASWGFSEPPAFPQALAPHFNSVRAWAEETRDEHQFVLLIVEMGVAQASFMDLGAVISERCFSQSRDINLLNQKRNDPTVMRPALTGVS